MAQAATYLVIYDVSDDKERRAVERVVEGFGFRVQKSAFECLITRGQRERLTGRLEALAIITGFIYLYRTAPNARRWAAGCLPEKQPETENEQFVFLA